MVNKEQRGVECMNIYTLNTTATIVEIYCAIEIKILTWSSSIILKSQCSPHMIIIEINTCLPLVFYFIVSLSLLWNCEGLHEKSVIRLYYVTQKSSRVPMHIDGGQMSKLSGTVWIPVNFSKLYIRTQLNFESINELIAGQNCLKKN